MKWNFYSFLLNLELVIPMDRVRRPKGRLRERSSKLKPDQRKACIVGTLKIHEILVWTRKLQNPNTSPRYNYRMDSDACTCTLDSKKLVEIQGLLT